MLVLLFLLSVARALQEVSVTSGGVTLHVPQSDNVFEVYFAEVGAAVITVVPSSAALIQDSDDMLRRQMFFDVGQSVHHDAGVCVGLFRDSLSAANLVACFGDAAACATAAHPLLHDCLFGMISATRAIDAQPAYQLVHLVVAGSSRSVGRTVDISLSIRTCQTSVSLSKMLDRTHILVEDEDTTSNRMVLIQNIDGAWAIPAGGTQVMINLEDQRPRGQQLDLFILSERGSSVTHFTVPYSGSLVAADLFDLDFDMHMRPPTLTLVLSNFRMRPALPEKTFMIMVTVDSAIHQDARVISNSNMDQPVTIDISRCEGLQRVTVRVMYLEGVVVFAKDKTFDPAVFCTDQRLDCFCGPSPGRRTAAAAAAGLSFELVVPIPAATPSEPYALIESVVTPPVPGECMAMDMVTGQTYVSNSTTSMCGVSVPSGTYAFYHMTDDTTHLYQQVIVCASTDPTATVVGDPASGLAFIKVDTGLSCPFSTSESADTTPATSVSLVGIQWFFSETHVNEVWESTGDDDDVLWFPQLGHYLINVTRSVNGVLTTSSVLCFVETDYSTLSITPPFCTDTVATLLVTPHVPLFATDHSAYAAISLSRDDDARFVTMAIQITEDSGVPGQWMVLSDAVLSSPYRYPIASGVAYDFLMLVVRRGSASDFLATSACYVDGGHVTPSPEVDVYVLSPIQVRRCDYPAPMADTVFFTVQSATPLGDDPPTASLLNIPVEIDIQLSPTQWLMSAGPITDVPNNYVPGSLVLTFKFGLEGQIVVTTLDTLLTQHLYPVPENPHPSTPTAAVDHSGEALFQCGGTVPTPDTSPSVNGCPRPPYALGRSGPLTQIVPLDVSVTVSPRSPGDTDAICAGKRFFTFSIPAVGSPPLFTYKTDDDADLGSISVLDQSVHAVTVNRADPIVLSTYYNPANSYMGAILPCTVTLPAAMFSADYVMGDFFTAPTIDLVSGFKSSCSPQNAAPEFASFNSGGLILRVQGAIDDVQLENSRGIPVLYRGYPATPADSEYIFSGLDTGVYVAQVQSLFSGSTCLTRQIFFVETYDQTATTAKPSAIPEMFNGLIDQTRTSSGTVMTPCPRSLFPDPNAWVQYYTIAFNADVYTKMAEDDDQAIISVNIWRLSTNTHDEISGQRLPSVIKYRIPAPDVYFAEVVITQRAEQIRCSHHLPPFTVTDPVFGIDSFAMEVVKYPTCMDSTDGVIRITYPAHVSVVTTFMACDPLRGAGACVRSATMDASNAGFVFINGLPFASRLVFNYEIMGACSFDGTYSFMPVPDLHPVIAQLQYVPSCDTTHFIVPLDASGTPIGGGGVKMFSWQVTSAQTIVQTSLQALLSFDPRVYRSAPGPIRVALTISYSGICTTGGTLTLDPNADIFVPPRVTIDPLLFDTPSSRSLPVFCPYSSDAMLVATVDPPLTDPGALAWSSGGTPSQINAATMVLSGIGAGTYMLTYQLATGALTCTSQDMAVIPAKTEYNLLSHLTVTTATCAGGTASASLDIDDMDDCDSPPEISAFTAGMLQSADRAYLSDGGSGATALTGVPDGHVMKVTIPYPDSYMYTGKVTCERPLIIDFGKVAPWPIFALDPAALPTGLAMNEELMLATGMDLMLYVPPWHADIDIQWNGRALQLSSPDHPQCVVTQPLPMKGPIASLWTTVIDPVTQVLACPYSAPLEVRVYNQYALTGDMFLQRTISSPLGFQDTLLAMDPAFQIIIPPPVTLVDWRIVDPQCNMEPTMSVALTLAVPSDTEVLADQVTVDGAGVACTVFRSVITCRISRMVAFYMHVPYISATNATCGFDIRVYDLVLEARDYRPTLKGSCFEDQPTICLPSDTGVVTFGKRQPGCAMFFTFAVFDPPPGVSEDDYLAVPVQVMSPSCPGASDGAIVWSMPASGANDTMLETDEPIPDSYVLSSLSAGFHFISYTHRGTPVYAGIRIYDPDYIFYVVQPANLPPPLYKTGVKGGGVVVGMPRAVFSPLEVMFYIHGGSELTQVTTGDGDPLKVQYHDDVYWQYTATATLQAGTTYYFDATCLGPTYGGKKRMAGVTLASVPQLRATIRVTDAPSSLTAVDGRYQVLIDGGAPPFTVITSGVTDVTYKTNARGIQSPLVGMGRRRVTVLDALGSVSLAEATLQPKGTFDIIKTAVTRQRGCTDGTTSTVEIFFADVTRPALAGAWNLGRKESPITDCGDRRMLTTFKTASSHAIEIDVPHPGIWLVAVCLNAFSTDQTTSGTTIAMSRIPLQVLAQSQTFTVSIKDGQVCLDSQRRYNAMSPAQILVSGTVMNGVINVRQMAGTEVVRAWSSRDFLGGLDLPVEKPGMYTYIVEDDQFCPVVVHAKFTDTGVGPCGSCDPHDHSCEGCDGVANSRKAVDICGICGGQDACLNDCHIEAHASTRAALAEVAACTKAGRAVTARREVILARTTLSGPSVSLSGPFFLVDGTRILSESTIALDGVTTSEDLELHGTSIRVSDSDIGDGTVHVLPPVIPVSGMSRRRGHAIDPPPVITEIVFISTGLSNVAMNTSGNVTVLIVNSTLLEIELVGVYGALNLTLDFNSSMPTLNITNLNVSANPNKTLDEIACDLFVAFPTLTTIYRGELTLVRSTYSCAGFGVGQGPSDADRKAESERIAIIVTLGIFGIVMFYLGVVSLSSPKS